MNIKRIVSILLFAAIGIGINSLLVHLYSGIMSSSIRMRLERKFHARDKKGVEVLVMGDSHCLSAVDERRIAARSLKWCSHAESYVQNYGKLKYYLAGQKPKLVVLPFDPHSFSFSRVKHMRDDFFWTRYVDYWELSVLSGDYLHFTGKYAKGAWFPYVGESSTFYEWLNKQLKKKKHLKKHPVKNPNKPRAAFSTGPSPVSILSALGGTVPASRVEKQNAKNKKAKKKVKKKAVSMFARMTPAKRLANGKKRAGHHFRGEPGERVSPVMIDYFIKIVRLCRREKVTLVLVKFPVSREYLRAASALISVDGLYRRVEGMLKENKCHHVHILDYQGLFFEKPHMMNDSDHLNRAGKQIVSRKIKRDIAPLLGK